MRRRRRIGWAAALGVSAGAALGVSAVAALSVSAGAALGVSAGAALSVSAVAAMVAPAGVAGAGAAVPVGGAGAAVRAGVPGTGAAVPTWRVEPTPNPKGALISQFEGVSCGRAALCFAAGYSSRATTSPLLESWDGTAWSITALPAPSPEASPPSASLYAIRCSAPKACTAVGNYLDSSSVVVPLVYAWGGGAWRTERAPSPPGAKTSTLFGVACTSGRDCTAVGNYENAQETLLGFAERWDGRAWSVERVPIPSSAAGSQLAAVDCPSASRCLAVGSYHNAGGAPQPMAEVSNGRAWAPSAAVMPGGATLGGLNSVRCAAPTSCTAVGFYQAASGVTETLAERWDGEAWAVEATPNPAGASSSFLDGIKCLSSLSCEAVGYYEKGVDNFTLAEAWNGHKWALQKTPNQAGASDSFLYGVTCVSPTACTAVASYQEGTKTFTLAEGYSG